MFVYALLFWGLVRRTMLVLFPMQCIHGTHRWHPRADEDVIFGVCPSDVPAHIQIAGVQVPLSVLLAAFLTIQAMPLFAGYMHRRRRRLRFLNDECLECGRPIVSFRGRCPGCGVRIGPG